MTTTRQPVSKKRKLRVLVVDDHPIFREGLAQLINHEPDLAVCATAETAVQALEAAGRLQPDIAVVDVSLKGGRDGMELMKELRARHARLPVLILSMHDESLYAERALRAGARGYITKQETSDKVLVAIRRILGGEVYLSEHMAARMLNRCVGDTARLDASPLERLSDRELQVFRLLGHGRNTRQVADELHVSISTVDSYRANIKTKLGLKNSTELLQHAVHWVESEVID
jgi:DNA-binding NarL/FixJ family response regulator